MSALHNSAIELIDGGAVDLDEVMATMHVAFDPAFGEAWTRAQCSGILGLAGVWLVLARRGSQAAGFALSRIVLDEAELLLLAVQPEQRRFGVGHALLSAVVGEARGRGAARLHLEMRDGNPAARLYEKAGFSEIGRRKGYYRGQNRVSYDAITLACRL